MDLLTEAQNTIQSHQLLTVHAHSGPPLAVFGTHAAVSRHTADLAWSAHGSWVLLEYRDTAPLIQSYRSAADLVLAIASRYPAELRALIRRHRYWRLFPAGSSLEWPSKPLLPHIFKAKVRKSA